VAHLHKEQGCFNERRLFAGRPVRRESGKKQDPGRKKVAKAFARGGKKRKKKNMPKLVALRFERKSGGGGGFARKTVNYQPRKLRGDKQRKGSAPSRQRG